MGASYLIVVDMQNDFVDGSLGTPEAQAIVENVVRKVRSFPGNVVFTLDTHHADYLSTQEGTLLPVEHCIEGTAYRKETFASVELARDLARANEEDPLECIELIGLCTDICVVSNALTLKGFMPEVPLSVDARCCAGVTPEAHEAALRTMESCQVRIDR